MMNAQAKRKKKPKQKAVSPFETAIKSWVEQLPAELLLSVPIKLDDLISRAPKRWVVYHPMVLLPSGSFGQEWWSLLDLSLIQEKHKDELWQNVLNVIAKREGKSNLTHLAINAGIPLQNISDVQRENILRTPSGLIALHGDFGPELDPHHQPSEKDFENAFWVSTKQNGIIQTWAPRYTMFSRGNIKEKARILEFHGSNQNLKSRRKSEMELGDQVAVDLYAGIGYFVFSYVKMGIGNVLGWELNPWSVEGLRRGAVANGWSVKVVREDEILDLGKERIIVVQEDNRKAAERLMGKELRNISHLNCGLLPTSEGIWDMSLEILPGDGWLHLHENVGVDDIEHRRSQVEEVLSASLMTKGDQREMKVEHVELVKTFAPGVWHCVFDVYISSSIK